MSHMEGDELHIDDQEASGGEKTGVMRWVLAISLLAAIVLLSAIWMTGALTQGDTEEEITQTGVIDDMQDGEATDSIVSDDADDLEAAISDAETNLDAMAEEADAPAEAETTE